MNIIWMNTPTEYMNNQGFWRRTEASGMAEVDGQRVPITETFFSNGRHVVCRQDTGEVVSCKRPAP